MAARISDLLLALAAIACSALGSASAAEMCRPREATTSFGRWFTPNLTLDARHWSTPVAHGLTGIKPASFRFSLAVRSATQDRRWNIVFRDAQMRALATLGPEDFADATHALTQRRWTGRLVSPVVTVDLIAAPSSDAVVTLDAGIAYAAESTDAQLFSTQGPTPSWSPLYGTGNMIPKRVGDAVGMLLGNATPPDNGPERSWCCSGVVVADDLMLTNWHCGGEAIPDAAYWNSDVVGNTIIDLGWDGGDVRRQYSGVMLIDKNLGLDFALVRVRPVVGAGGAGALVPARVSTRPVADGDPIFLIHHAQCRPKLLSTNCHVRSARFPGWTAATGPEAAEPDFTHDCDSEPGASVFDVQGRLVGLHHLGFQTKPECGVDHVNKAIRIGEIVDYLRVTHPEIVTRLRLD